MSRRVSCGVSYIPILLVALGCVAVPNTTNAQSTVVLDAPDSESIDTTIRGGSYASTNMDGQPLATRAHTSDPFYVRRAVLKFDTETRVPKGAQIQSAKLTLTVKGGNTDTRTLSAYRLATSFDERVATWKIRKSGYSWTSAGGDTAGVYAQATATGTPGSKVTFDVTKLVQDVVNSKFEVSRWTRIAVIDAGSTASGSYREFYPSESNDPTVRPMLTVVYGGSSTPTASPAPTTSPTPTTSSGSSKTVRVLTWNSHHGGIGTDGKYDPNRFISWAVKMAPDVVMFQEVEPGQESGLASLLKSKTGVTWNYRYKRGSMVASKLPLNSTSTCLLNVSADNHASHMSVVVNGRSLNVWGGHFSLSSSSVRVAEIKALQACQQNWSEARIAGGDFNMQASTTEHAAMTSVTRDAWPTAKAAGTAINFPGNCDGCTRNSRIDYVFASKGASWLVLKSAQIYDTRDSNGYRPSDHKPMVVTYTVN